MIIPNEIEKIALFAYGNNKKDETIGGGQVVPVKDYLIGILRELKNTPIMSRAVPEKYPILRVMQMIANYWTYFDKELKKT